MLRRIALAAAVAAAGWTLAVASAAAGTITVAPTKILIDPATCAQLQSALKEQSAKFTVAQQTYLRGAKSTDCYLMRDSSSSANLSALRIPTLPGITEAAATTYCQDWYDDLGIYSGPFEVATAHNHWGDCWDYTYVWKNWHDCHTTSVPGIGTDTTWCGEINNYTTGWMTFGMNFDIWPYSAPTFKKYGYIRDQNYPNGAERSQPGFPCYPC